MKEDTSVSSEDKNEAIINLQKVKSEIEEEEEPDKGRIKKWLSVD